MDLEALKYVSDLGTTGMVVFVIVWAVRAIGAQMGEQAEKNEQHIKEAREAERKYLEDTRQTEREHVRGVLAMCERTGAQATEQAKHLAEIGRSNIELARELRGLAEDMKSLKR